ERRPEQAERRRPLVELRPHSLRRPRLRALRLHARPARTQQVQRRLRQGVAAVPRPPEAARGQRREVLPRRRRPPRQRAATGDLRRASALLLRGRPEAGSDPLSRRLGVRWLLASRPPERHPGPMTTPAATRPPEAKVDCYYRCSGCAYGITVVRRFPSRCPMCGG